MELGWVTDQDWDLGWVMGSGSGSGWDWDWDSGWVMDLS